MTAPSAVLESLTLPAGEAERMAREEPARLIAHIQRIDWAIQACRDAGEYQRGIARTTQDPASRAAAHELQVRLAEQGRLLWRLDQQYAALINARVAAP